MKTEAYMDDADELLNAKLQHAEEIKHEEFQVNKSGYDLITIEFTKIKTMNDEITQYEDLKQTRGQEIKGEYKEVGKMKQKVHDSINK
jgi:hypothetical protein